MSAQLERTTAAHAAAAAAAAEPELSGEETVPWWQPAVCVPHGPALLLHQHLSLHIHKSRILTLAEHKKRRFPTTASGGPPRVAEYPAETTRIASAQDNNKKKMGRSWQCHRMSNINC